MLNYRLIIEYYQKGNNNSQIATLCGCSRPSVIKVINRVLGLNRETKHLLLLSDKELNELLFPNRKQYKDDYLMIDFVWEEFQMVKHKSSIRLCWRRYCKRAVKQNLKAYTWRRYLTLYHEYKTPPKANDKDKIRKRLQDYNFLLSMFRNKEGRGYQKMKKDKEEWLKSLHLEENKILD